MFEKECMRRNNKKVFEKVEVAIRLADKGLVTDAAKLCRAIGVPIDVAYRVILKPTNRRKGN